MNSDIWNDQKKFNSQFFSDQSLDIDNLSVSEKVEWAKEFYFHINKELSDLIDCLPHWKMHYKNEEIKSNLIKSNLKEEYIDSFKYFMGLGQILGIDLEDIETVYWAKTEVVNQKYNQNKIFESLKDHEIVVFDVDGVINTYPHCYLDWVSETYGLTYKTMKDIKSDLDIETYERIKEHYRLSGEKAHQPVNWDTVYTMKTLKDQGETIVLYTARPASRYKRIYSDTLKWLKANNIPFDAIYWTDFQKEDFYKLGLHVKFIVEDDIRNTKFFSGEGYKVYLINYDHNQGYEHDLVRRIDNPREILSQEDIV